MHDRGTGKGKHMKIAQRKRRPAGWDDEQIAGIHAADTDIVLIRRPVPVECAEIVARGRVGEVRFHTTARGAKNKIDRGLDHLELKAPGGPRARLADDILGLVCGMLAGFDWPRVEVRLDLADVQACPKFHSDNVLVRLDLISRALGIGAEVVRDALYLHSTGKRPPGRIDGRCRRPRKPGQPFVPRYKQIAAEVDRRRKAGEGFDRLAREMKVSRGTVLRAYDFANRDEAAAAAREGRKPTRRPYKWSDESRAARRKSRGA